MSSATRYGELLDRLCRAVTPAPGREYSYEEIAAGVREHGYEMSAAYVWQLRKGRRDNPSARHLEGLARFFGVPVAFFFDSVTQDRVEKEIDLLASMRDTGVRLVALRAHGLSARGTEAVLQMIDYVRSMENMPEVSRE